MKFNKKMLFGTIGALLAGIFGIIAFYALKFRIDGENTGIKLNDFNQSGMPDWMSAIYGCGIAGLVFAFIGMVFPLVSMFYENEKLDKAFGIMSMLFAVLGLVLMVAAVAVWTGKVSSMGDDMIKVKVDAGYTAGQFIFVIVGGALAIAGNAVSYKEALAK